MQSVPLEYSLQHCPQAALLVIQFPNPYFLQCVKLTTLQFPSTILSQYEYQVHPKYISFRGKEKSEKDKEAWREDIDGLARVVEGILDDVRVTVVELRDKVSKQRLYTSMFKLLDFSSCLGHKLLKNPTNTQLLLFHFPSQQPQLRKLLTCIEGFSSITVHYCLTDFILKHQIPQNVTMQALREMVNFYHEEIQVLGVYYMLEIGYMTVCRRSESPYMSYDQQKQYYLALCMQGVLSNLHQFYQALEHTLSTLALHILPIPSIRSPKVNTIQDKFPYGDGCRMLDPWTICLMDRRVGMRMLRDTALGWYVLGGEVFGQRDLEVIESQGDGRFGNFMAKGNGADYTYQQIKVVNSYVLIKCQHAALPLIIKQMKTFLQKYVRQTIKCPQFPTELVSTIFYKKYRHLIEKEFNVKFEHKNGQVYRTNFTIDSYLIKQQINLIKEEIMANFITVPSLNTISQYLAKQSQFEALYTVDKNPGGMWQKNWKSILYRFGKRVNITLTQFQNLVHFQQSIIFLMHNDLPDFSAMLAIPKENKIDVNQFLNGCSGQKGCRVKRFNMENSASFRSVTLLYFDVKKIALRHVQEDLQRCLKSNEKQQSLNFLIGVNSKRFIEQIMPRFLNKVRQLTEKQKINLKNLTIYYEEASLLSQIQRTIVNFNAETSIISRDVFDDWSLLRMNNLKEFVLFYYWNQETFSLPGIDSYIFNLEKSRDYKARALVTIPTPQHLQKQFHQFFVDLKLNKIYEVCSFCTIIEQIQQKMSKQFNRIIEIIKAKFNHVNFFVIYAKNYQDEIGKQVCLNIYYKPQAGKSEDSLKPLNFDLQTGKVSLKQAKPLIYKVIHKQYVDWFKINTHETMIENIEKCLQK